MNTEQKLIDANAGAFYVFDTEVLRRRVERLRELLPKDVRLCYAVKANTFIIGAIEPYIDRLEVCSPGEAEICRQLNADTNKMVISGVYKTPSVIEALIADTGFNGIFTAESLRQYQQICYDAKRYNRRVSVLLRVTNDSQFGMDEEIIEQIIAERAAHAETNIIGIQYFSGTQKTSIKKLRREILHLDALLTRLNDLYGYTAEELEYGTGFPVAYFKSDEIDEEELIRGFGELIGEMVNRPRIIIELGRSIAASCGTYYTHIVDMKRNRGQNYLLVDGGMHQIVYFGQSMAMKQPYVTVAGREEEPVSEAWNICGSLCSMNDIIVKQTPLPEIAIGDVLRFENTGAYCATEGIALFLSRDLPAVYLRGADGKYICVRNTIETAEFNSPIRKEVNNG